VVLCIYRILPEIKVALTAKITVWHRGHFFRKREIGLRAHFQPEMD